ncbi:MAG: hypothetical protein QM784_05735 [Polyangiaceae bacterium]
MTYSSVRNVPFARFTTGYLALVLLAACGGSGDGNSPSIATGGSSVGASGGTNDGTAVGGSKSSNGGTSMASGGRTNEEDR